MVCFLDRLKARWFNVDQRRNTSEHSRSTSIFNTRFCISNRITGQLPVLATVHEVCDSGIELFEHSMD